MYTVEFVELDTKKPFAEFIATLGKNEVAKVLLRLINLLNLKMPLCLSVKIYLKS